MIEIAAVSVAVAFCALGFALVLLRREQQRVVALEADIDAVEGHNRTLTNERDGLKSTLGETSQALDATIKLLETTEAEKRDVEQQRATLAETADRLEKARAELDRDLAKLRGEHETLEKRVITFQGQWSHQLTTLEAEISTVIRQLGEFRKGTQLPIARPDADGASTTPAASSIADEARPQRERLVAQPPTPAPALDPSWAFSAPIGPRLATRPRPVSAEPAANVEALPAPTGTARLRQ